MKTKAGIDQALSNLPTDKDLEKDPDMLNQIRRATYPVLTQLRPVPLAQANRQQDWSTVVEVDDYDDNDDDDCDDGACDDDDEDNGDDEDADDDEVTALEAWVWGRFGIGFDDLVALG